MGKAAAALILLIGLLWASNIQSGVGSGNLFSSISSVTVSGGDPATSIIGTVTGSKTIPANRFTAGMVAVLMAEGFTTTAGGSLQLDVKLGGSTRITGTIRDVPGDFSDATWFLSCAITTRTVGVSGTQIGNCSFVMAAPGVSLTCCDPTPSFAMPVTSPWTIDTTGTIAVDVVATVGTVGTSLSTTNVSLWTH